MENPGVGFFWGGNVLIFENVLFTGMLLKYWLPALPELIRSLKSLLDL